MLQLRVNEGACCRDRASDIIVWKESNSEWVNIREISKKDWKHAFEGNIITKKITERPSRREHIKKDWVWRRNIQN